MAVTQLSDVSVPEFYAEYGGINTNRGGLALVNPGKRRPHESREPVADQIVARFLGPRTRHPGRIRRNLNTNRPEAGRNTLQSHGAGISEDDSHHSPV